VQKTWVYSVRAYVYRMVWDEMELCVNGRGERREGLLDMIVPFFFFSLLLSLNIWDARESLDTVGPLVGC
jgi:hypothetical protein